MLALSVWLVKVRRGPRRCKRAVGAYCRPLKRHFVSGRFGALGAPANAPRARGSIGEDETAYWIAPLVPVAAPREARLLPLSEEDKWVLTSGYRHFIVFEKKKKQIFPTHVHSMIKQKLCS